MAHWAASGGDEAICRLLAREHGVDFLTAAARNAEGNTPLSKAVAQGRADVASWLAGETALAAEGGEPGAIVAATEALQLARQLVEVTRSNKSGAADEPTGEPVRQEILGLLESALPTRLPETSPEGAGASAGAA